MLEYGVQRAIEELEGSFSLVIMGTDITQAQLKNPELPLSKKMMAVRDRQGRKPLAYGSLPGGGTAMGSETGALEDVEATEIRSVGPGQIVTVGKEGLKTQQFLEADPHYCVLEAAYLTDERHNEELIGRVTNHQRRRFGEELAIENPHFAKADIIIPVPQTGIAATRAFAQQLGVADKYQEIIIKNTQDRTFITNPDDRLEAARLKYSLSDFSVKGLRCVVVDDSIIRGSTGGVVTEMLFAAGASEVHFVSALPRVEHPCEYGVDINSHELYGPNLTDEGIAKSIGATSVTFLSLEGMNNALDKAKGVCTDCLTRQTAAGRAAMRGIAAAAA
jgi:amidophosphoribosyltransferase